MTLPPQRPLQDNTPRMLVLEITPHVPGSVATYQRLEKFPVTLGRGYHNDIILSDPHVSAAHLRLDRAAEGFVVYDLGSENGVWLNGRRMQNQSAVASGDRLRLGVTELRVLAPDHAVPPPPILQRASAFLNALPRSIVVWPLLVLALAALTGQAYLQTWSADVGKKLAVALAIGGFAILLWSLIWAVAGRLIRSKSRFRSHVSLVSLGILLLLACFNVQEYIDFLTNQNGLSVFLNYAIDALFLTWLLIYSLALATDMTQRRRRLAAFFFSTGLMLGIFALSVVGMQGFNPLPTYASQMEPYLAGLAPAKTPKAFMQDNAALFQAKTFHKVPSGKVLEN